MRAWAKWTATLLFAGGAWACAAPRPAQEVATTIVAKPPAAPLSGQRFGASTADVPVGSEVGPLAISYASPQGEAPSQPPLVILFNQPLRALAPGGTVADLPIEIEPPLAGRWEFVGNRAVRFVPDQPLADASQYAVVVRAGLPSLGESLAEDFRFEFSTPAPRLVETWPIAGQTHVETDVEIELRFNLPIAPAEIAERITITADGVAVPFDVKRPHFVAGSDEPRPDHLLSPRSLPGASEIRVTIDEGLRSPAGERALGRAQTIAFKTRGPVEVLSLRCRSAADDAWIELPSAARCSPDAGFEIVLDAPVGAYALSQALAGSLGASVSAHEEGEEEGRYRYRIDTEVEPRSVATLTLDPRLFLDETGYPLVRGLKTSFLTGDRKSHGWLAVRGTYWDHADRLEIPLVVTNVGEAELAATRLSQSQAVAYLLDGQLPETVGFLEPQGFGSSPTNEPIRLHASIEDLLGGSRSPGMIAVLARFGAAQPPVGGASASTMHVFTSSKMSVHASTSRNQVQAWVTERASNRPVPGANVAVFGTASSEIPLGTAIADESGLATVDLPISIEDRDQVVIAARSGDDETYLLASGVRHPAPIGLVFTDRGLYRPDEVVRIKGIVRTVGDETLEVPRHQPMRAVITDPAGREVRSVSVTTNELGSFSMAMHIDAEAPLGQYFVEVSSLEHEDTPVTRYGRGWFQVAEYQPAAFEVEVSLPQATYMRHDAMRCTGRATYLHGGPLANKPAQFTVDRDITHYEPPGHDDFDFSNRSRDSDLGADRVVDRMLDAQGASVLEYPLELSGMTGPERVSCSISARDFDQTEYIHHASALVHASDLYVGIGGPSGPFLMGEAGSVEVLATDPAGVMRDDAITVEVELAERDGWEAPWTFRSVARCELPERNAVRACAFEVPTSRSHTHELRIRASARDSRGFEVVASSELGLVAPPEPTEPTMAPPPEPEEQSVQLSLGFSADRELYEAGESATIALQSPFSTPAQTLLSLQRESVLWQRVFSLPPGKTTLEVPLSPNTAPNVEASLVLLGPDAYHEATIDFDVEAPAAHLEVELDASGERVAPGSQLRLEVAVSDHQGEPVPGAEVTLWGADVATLLLARYMEPRPERLFWRKRWAVVESEHTREDPMEILHGGWHRTRAPSVRMGASGLGLSDIRGDFRQSVVFEPDLRTNAQGKVELTVDLPDGLTTYRFFALVATEESAFGIAQTEVQTDKPLMVTPRLPRVVRPGDAFDAVTNIVSKHDGTVIVELAADGLVVDGAAKRHVQVRAGVPHTVSFPVRAEKAGRYRVRIRAQRSQDHDSVVLSGDVEAPALMETAVVFGTTAVPIAELLSDLDVVRHDVGGIEVTLASTPLAALKPGIDSLIEYPYGCTEQLASRMLPLSTLRSLADSVGAELPADVPNALGESVLKLLSHQRDDGGFGLWPHSAESAPWLTTYAVAALRAADQAGTPVDRLALSAADAYLDDSLDDMVRRVREGQPAFPELAAIADLRAQGGSVHRDAFDVLFERRDELAPIGRAHLLSLAARAGDEERLAVLIPLVSNGIAIDGSMARVHGSASERPTWLDLPLSGSDIQLTAVTLRALVAAAPDHPMIEPLVRGLLVERARWRTTQEAAWVMLALDAYRRQHPNLGAPVTARLFLGDTLAVDQELSAEGKLVTSYETDLLSLREAALGGDDGDDALRLTVDTDGPGSVSYEARFSYASLEGAAHAVDQGLFIERRFEHASGYAADGLHFELGELVRVELTVVTPFPRSFVAIDDALPGGLVAVDPALRERAPESGAGGGYQRRELRDDRVVFFVDEMEAGVHRFSYYARASFSGSFTAPPTVASEMYAPETRGHTAETAITVAPPR